MDINGDTFDHEQFSADMDLFFDLLFDKLDDGSIGIERLEALFTRLDTGAERE